MPSRWTPRVTLAAVIEREGKFLLIEEETALGLMLNNPAGHLERAPSQPARAEVHRGLHRRCAAAAVRGVRGPERPEDAACLGGAQHSPKREELRQCDRVVRGARR